MRVGASRRARSQGCEARTPPPERSRGSGPQPWHRLPPLHTATGRLPPPGTPGLAALSPPPTLFPLACLKGCGASCSPPLPLAIPKNPRGEPWVAPPIPVARGGSLPHRRSKLIRPCSNRHRPGPVPGSGAPLSLGDSIFPLRAWGGGPPADRQAPPPTAGGLGKGGTPRGGPRSPPSRVLSQLGLSGSANGESRLGKD